MKTAEEIREYHHAYNRRPEVKAKGRARARRPEVKAKLCARRQTPEAKAKLCAYKQTSEYKARMNAYQKTPGVRFSSIKLRAKKRGIEVTITRQEFVALWPPAGSLCPVCLNEMKPNSRYAPSADRRDNCKGYVPGNVVIICNECNSLKRETDSNRLHRLGLYAAGLIGTDYKTDPAVLEQARAILGAFGGRVSTAPLDP